MKKKKIAPKILWVLSVLTLIFLWAPVVLIIVYSFSNNKYGSSWEGFTTKWYVKLFTNDQVRDALMRSLIIAGVTVVVSTIIGTITAYGLYKLNFKGKHIGLEICKIGRRNTIRRNEINSRNLPPGTCFFNPILGP